MTILPFLNRIISFILNPLIYLAFGLATAYLFFNIVKFLSKQPGDKERDEAWKAALWTIVGMALMFSVFGLIRFVLDSFGIRPSDFSGSPGTLWYLGL
ncbi:MAG: hypothetical protein AB198_00745 [Parcubacteria bacterium C7867-003]|nr:MAG: hypothetical protein AB198_00745 [Parcubacteria bacterium C7867-003]